MFLVKDTKIKDYDLMININAIVKLYKNPSVKQQICGFTGSYVPDYSLQLLQQLQSNQQKLLLAKK